MVYSKLHAAGLLVSYASSLSEISYRKINSMECEKYTYMVGNHD